MARTTILPEAGWCRTARAAGWGALGFHAVVAAVLPLVVLDFAWTPGVSVPRFFSHVIGWSAGVLGYGVGATLLAVGGLLPLASAVAWSLDVRPTSVACRLAFASVVSMAAFGAGATALALRFGWTPLELSAALCLAGIAGQLGVTRSQGVELRPASVGGPRVRFRLRGLLVATAWVAAGLTLATAPIFRLGGVGQAALVALAVQPLAAALLLKATRRPGAGHPPRKTPALPA